MVRKPVVAGQFYAGDKGRLEKDLDDMIPQQKEKINVIGAVSPHAGYVYSGAVAGLVYGRLSPADVYIILSPNHTGYGARFALSAESWSTPLGEVQVDGKIASSLTDKTKLIEENRDAHAYEHSVEVQIPFIQRVSPRAKIVPMTVQSGSPAELEEVAGAIASSIMESGQKATIIASSDMTHYESRDSASKKDRLAIQKILDLDPEGLLNVVKEMDISMCGCIPAAIMLMASKKLGAKKAELVHYTDSGDVTGDTFQVVGYAGIIVF